MTSLGKHSCGDKEERGNSGGNIPVFDVLFRFAHVVTLTGFLAIYSCQFFTCIWKSVYLSTYSHENVTFMGLNNIWFDSPESFVLFHDRGSQDSRYTLIWGIAQSDNTQSIHLTGATYEKNVYFKYVCQINVRYCHILKLVDFENEVIGHFIRISVYNSDSARIFSFRCIKVKLAGWK